MLTLVRLLLLLLVQSPTPTPPTPPVDVATPNDPTERMELADKLNGLHGVDTPWHLKASYEVFGNDGKSADKGTFEQWQVSDKQYRIAFHSPSVSVEEFGTDHGIFRTGTQEWPRHPLSSIAPIIARPVPPQKLSEKMTFANYHRQFATEILACTGIKTRPDQTPPYGRSYCFASTNAALLYATPDGGGVQRLFQNIKLVHGHYLAYVIQQFIGSRRWLTVHVDLLEDLDTAGLSALAIPADATPASGRLSSEGDFDPGHLVKKIAPTYPFGAKAMGVQGTVIVGGLIGKDGHVTGVQVLAGAEALRQASIDAVRQWIYTPYVHDGQPVEVETEINVVYSLGR